MTAWRAITPKSAPSRLAMVAAVLVLLQASPARAHPHIWIDAHLDIRIDNMKVTNITVTWMFDEIFSYALIEEFDRDVNNIFTATEVAELQANAFAALKESGYFTHFRQMTAFPPSVAGFSAWIEGDRIGYSFDISAPDVPLTEGLDISVYDETFYVDVILDEAGPVTLSGPGAAACLYRLSEDAQNPIYFDLILPQLVTVQCDG